MKRVLLLLSNGFEAYEAAAFSDVLGFASTFGEEEIEVITVGLHPQLQCTFGFKVMPEMLLGEVRDEDFDAVAVPGGFERAGFYNDAYSDAFGDVLRRFAAAGKPVAAICTGALPVARQSQGGTEAILIRPALHSDDRCSLASRLIVRVALVLPLNIGPIQFGHCEEVTGVNPDERIGRLIHYRGDLAPRRACELEQRFRPRQHGALRREDGAHIGELDLPCVRDPGEGVREPSPLHRR